MLEWVAYSFSRESSQVRNWTGISCFAGRFFTNWATREAPDTILSYCKDASNVCSKQTLEHKAFIKMQNILALSLVEGTVNNIHHGCSVQSSSVAQSCQTLCDPMDCSLPCLPVHHQLPESTQTHVHRVDDAIQPSHPLSSPSPPALNLSQHQGLFQWVNSSHEVAKVLEFQLQHQSFHWTPRTDLL